MKGNRREFLRTAIGGMALLSYEPVLAQQPVPSPVPPDLPDRARVARVESVSGRTICAFDGSGPFTLHASDPVKVWKGKLHSDLSPLRPGDIIGVRLHKDAAGEYVADEIWANIVSIHAVVSRVVGDRSEVVLNPQAKKPETRTVVWTRDGTEFENSLPEDIRPGRSLFVIGLDLGDGVIQASRIVVYEGNRPVRRPNVPIQPRMDSPK